MTAAQRDAIARSLHAQPHRILGVPVDADEPTLRRAYRAAAKLLHPDKCTLPDAEAAFKRVSTAFEQLLIRAPVASSKAPAAASDPVPSQPPPPAPAAPAATVWPSRNRAGGAKFTVRVAQAPQSRAPTRQPAQAAAAAVEEEDEEPEVANESSDEESSDEGSSDEGVTFADGVAPSATAWDEEGTDMNGEKPKSRRGGARAKKPSRRGAANDASQGGRHRRKKKRRRREALSEEDDEDEAVTGLADEDDWRPAALSKEGGGVARGSERRSVRNARRARVNYAHLGEGGEEEEEGEAEGEGGTAWAPPLWFEYQTDSDDSEGEVQRKKALKERVLAAKRAANDPGAGELLADGAAAAPSADRGTHAPVSVHAVAASLAPTAQRDTAAAARAEDGEHLAGGAQEEEALGENDDVDEEDDDLDMLIGD